MRDAAGVRSGLADVGRARRSNEVYANVSLISFVTHVVCKQGRTIPLPSSSFSREVQV